MSVQTLDEAKIVEDALKTMGEPVRLRDIVELTKDRVKWREIRAMTSQMQTFMKQVPTIGKAGHGMYKYVEVNRKDDDSVLEVSDKDRELLESFRKTAQPMFSKPKPKHQQKSLRFGDTMEGKVTGIEEYGVFIENEYGMQGLIHITNVSKSPTSDLRRHFKLGDKVTAKVLSVKSDKKLSLSTKDFPLPDYFVNDVMADKLRPIAGEMKDVEVHTANTLQEVKVEIPKREDREDMKEVYKFIQGITGVVSEQAKEKLNELINDSGMFKFTMALAEAQKEFEVDVSMILANAIEEKIRGGL